MEESSSPPTIDDVNKLIVQASFNIVTAFNEKRSGARSPTPQDVYNIGRLMSKMAPRVDARVSSRGPVQKETQSFEAISFKTPSGKNESNSSSMEITSPPPPSSLSIISPNVSKATEISSDSKKNVHVITAVNMNFKRQDSEEMSDFDNTSVGGDYDLLLPTDSTNGHLSSEGGDSTDMSTQNPDPNSMQAEDGSVSSKISVHSSPLSQVPPILTSSLTSLKSPTMVLPLSQKRT